MKKTMNRFCYFFLVLTAISFGLCFFEKERSQARAQAILKASPSSSPSPLLVVPKVLPDEDSTMLNSLLSALGGFSGGGLLLIFLIRRLVTSYDDTFKKWDTRCGSHQQRQEEKNDKLICMIEDIQEKTHELKVEMIKLQVNSAEKQIVTDALTKVAVIETDVSQVRGEVKSIMTHLLNKPRMSGINRNNL
jgi:hypothetical protein